MKNVKNFLQKITIQTRQVYYFDYKMAILPFSWISIPRLVLTVDEPIDLVKSRIQLSNQTILENEQVSTQLISAAFVPSQIYLLFCCLHPSVENNEKSFRRLHISR